MPRNRNSNNEYVVPGTDLTSIRRDVGRNYGYTGDPGNLQYFVAQRLNIPLQPGYNGALRSREAGRIGGNIGGPMVREMIRFAERQLAKGVRPQVGPGGGQTRRF